MDHYSEETVSAADGGIGADRMRLGLPIIPDPRRGDVDTVAVLLNACIDAERTIDALLLAPHPLVVLKTAKQKLQNIRNAISKASPKPGKGATVAERS